MSCEMLAKASVILLGPAGLFLWGGKLERDQTGHLPAPAGGADMPLLPGSRRQLLAGLPEEEQRYTGTLYINTPEPGLLEEKARAMHQTVEGKLRIYHQAQAAQEEWQFKLLLKVFITGFIVLITGICIANIINTISTSIALRRREFAMLKWVGIECVLRN